jgi:hypothetical protein
MNAMTGQKQQDFSSIWVTNSGAISGAVELNKLSPEQIGIFPADDYSAGQYLGTSTPSFKKNKRFFLAQGIQAYEGQNYPNSTRKPDFPRISQQFEASDIVKWEGLKAKKGATTGVVAIGYDGINANKSINAKTDVKPVIIRIILEGEPIKKFFNAKDGRLVREYSIDKNTLVGDCNCVDTCGKVPAQDIADGLIAAIKQDKFNGQAITNFVRASKIQKCASDLTVTPSTIYKKYVTTVADDGTSTIGYLGAAGQVSVEKREGINTTYAVWLKSTDAAPTAVTLTGSVIPDCGSCPSGYTSVPEAHVYDIKVLRGVTVPTLPGALSVTKLGSDGHIDGYVALLSLTWDHDADGGTTPEIAVDLDDVNALLEPVATSYTYLGKRTQICTSDTDVTITWVDSTITKQSINKDLGITLGDTVCGTSRLTEVQAAYPALTVTQDALDGSCVHVYKTTVESNLVDPEDCDKYESYTFEKLTDFDGIGWYDWTAVQENQDCTAPGAVAAVCCSAGVVLEGAVFNSYYKDCTFGWYNWHPNDALPVKVQITAHSSDYTNNLVDEGAEFVTVLRQPQVNRGTSGALVQEYERSMLAYEDKHWQPNPFVNEINGFQVNAKPYFMYDQYSLTLRRKGHDTTYGINEQNLMTYTFYVKENEGKALETLVNSLVESAGRSDLKAVVL